MSGAEGLRVRPAGRHALLVECADADQAGALHAELLRRRAAGALAPVREIVPGARTVLLDGVAEPEALAREVGAWDLAGGGAADGDVVTVPVVYDGPDLAEVAGFWGVSVEEVAAVHSSYEYRVAFCGFAPGFGYLSGLPEELRVPRRATPRTRVPAGAVAVAGPYSAVYPRATPGGWQLIGTMPDPGVLWDVSRSPAALLAPGTRVRFAATASTPRGSAPGPAPQSPAGLDSAAGSPSPSDLTSRGPAPDPAAQSPQGLELRAGSPRPTDPTPRGSAPDPAPQSPAGLDSAAGSPSPTDPTSRGLELRAASGLEGAGPALGDLPPGAAGWARRRTVQAAPSEGPGHGAVET